MKITMRVIPHPKYFKNESAYLEVDGKIVAQGSFGGEPEDNNRYRDYKWVQKWIQELCELTGHEYEFIKDEEID